MSTYWENAPTDKPWLLNGFKGTWNFSDHSLIPAELNNFLHEAFHPVERLKRVPLEEINKVMNQVWDGPGSMVKLEKLTAEMRNARMDKVMSTPIKLDEVRTIDDYDEDEKTSSVLDTIPSADDD